MKSFRVLFLSLLINSFLLRQGSCLYDEIINALQKTIHYEIIELTKILVGDDPAVIYCIENPDIQITNTICKYIVKVIMGNYRPSSFDPKYDIEDILSEINATNKFKVEIRKLYKEADNKSRSIIYVIISHYNFLIKKKKEKEILTLIRKMILLK